MSVTKEREPMGTPDSDAADAFADHYNEMRGAAWAEAVMNGATIDHGRFTMQVIEDEPALLLNWLVEAGILPASVWCLFYVDGDGNEHLSQLFATEADAKRVAGERAADTRVACWSVHGAEVTPGKGDDEHS